ncbi:MAG: cysteine desulfurase [Deltaproteobacteria bacterium]|nr:cysteine desulfurase [Deltaproteobacteria bacterium]
MTGLDVDALRKEFPILARTVHGKPLVYLDSAASSQKPACVIAAIVDYYERHHSNVHRGVHTLSEEATVAYERARAKVQKFVRAASPREIVFARGTTEAINLVAQAWARPRLGPGDEVLITELEHHSNLVPWQIVCQQTGARLVVAPIDATGTVIPEEYERRLSKRTRLVALAHVSNALGTVLPVAELTRLAKQVGATVLVDGAQAVPHMPVDVTAIGCDFYAFSGHKMYAPTGIGALFGRLELLESMEPWQGGGSMIRNVTFEKTTWAAPPERFEAGTPNIAGAVGLGAAIDFLDRTDLAAVQQHEADLVEYASRRLAGIPGVRLIGTARERAGLVSFVVGDVHAHDVGTILDGEGIAVRAGHHCAQPVMDHFDVPATARASFAVHNGRDDVDRLVAGVERVREIFA